MSRTETTTVEAILRDELARENRALSGVAPVISHMLENSGHALVSDAIVARVRGMLGSLAGQLLLAGMPSGRSDPLGDREIDALADALAADPGLLDHLYALAMEGHLTERLEQRSSLDPVLSPLLQELIASDRAETAELAMTVLAAQSRFVQGQRRMALSLDDLPARLFSAVLDRFEAKVAREDPATAKRAIDALKDRYDESAGRISLLARLVKAIGGGAMAALELDHAGLALFASGLARLSKQDRDLAVLACHERQAARLALSLRATGLEADAIERQFLLLEPSEMLPRGIAELPASRAAELLAGAGN